MKEDRGVNEPVSITNANGGFPSGPSHKGPPSKSTSNAFNGPTKAMSRDIATVALMGVTIAMSICLNRDTTLGRGSGGARDSRSWCG